MYSLTDYSVDIILFIIFLYTLHYIYAFYSQLKHYPPGPKPLPLFGNSLMLIRHLNQNPSYFFKNLTEVYGDVYTFWLCTKPFVIIGSNEMARQAFNNNDFCDRSHASVESLLNSNFMGGNKAFVFMNFNRDCKVLRKISNEAIRKFLSDNKLENISREIVDQTVSVIKRIEGQRDFDAEEYIDYIFVRLLTQSMFGKAIDFDNKQYIRQIAAYFEHLQKNIMPLILSEYFPSIKYFVDITNQNPVIKNTIGLFTKWYTESESAMNCNNICDLIRLSSDSKRNLNSSNEMCLNQSNIIGCLITLFIAGSDTTHMTFKWLLLLMAYYPEMQQRMRDEIKTNIGDKTPETSDKDKCVFVVAFICETLRFRIIAPFGVFHYTACNTKIGDTPIPKGTSVLLNLVSILNDGRHWKNPECFNPERFIDCDNRLNASDLPSFIPFSTGKRMCIGDKFAINMLFLVLTRFIQSTDGQTLILSDKQSIDLEPKKYRYVTIEPKLFNVRFVKQ